jgi:hypothetical protein
MRHLMSSKARILLWSIGLFAGVFLAAASEEIPSSGQVLVQSVQGLATCSTNRVTWVPLRPGAVLGAGAILKTEADSTADLILKYSGSVLRMMPDTEIEVAKLDVTEAGEEIITETSLQLKSGSVIGSQRKLAKPSMFTINLPGGVVTIQGTEYVVRADGAVSCLSGAVSVIYNLPRNRGSVKVVVPAGYSFDPATGDVVPTTPAYLENLIAHIKTVAHNAKVFKFPKGTVIVKPIRKVSPCERDHHHWGHGHDGDGGHGHDRDGGRGYDD